MLLICEQCGKTFESERRSKKYCSCACSNRANGKKRATEFENQDEKIVWSCGAGIQSTAIAVLICQGKLPKPDFAFMADCGYESDRTYDYINRVLKPNLAEADVDLQVVPSCEYVEVEIMDKNGRCNLPAYRKNEDGTVSHLSTRCNGTWKQRVMKNWLREQGATKVIDWVGISTDEARRAGKNTGLNWVTNAYPLIDLNMSRRDCVDLIRDAGWEMPLRTSCIMCPQRTLFEWVRLSVDCPEDFERACQMEDEIRKIDQNVFLNGKCRPLREVIEGE